MSDLSKFAATLGGALSAQATGGSQGLQNFMASLNQQQAQESQQEFAREQQTRDRMFTMHRDRLQREHEEKQLATKLAAEKTEKEEGYRGTAGALYHYAMANPKNRGDIQSHLMEVLPALKLMEGGINWEDKEEAIDIIMDAARTGFTVGQARDISAERRTDEEWYRTNTNNALQYSSVPNLAIHKQNQTTASGKLADLRSKAGVIDRDIQVLDDDQGRSLTKSFEAATKIRERLEALNDEYGALTESDQFSPYFTPGTLLSNQAAEFANNVGSIGNSLATAQSNLAIDSIGPWSPSNPLDFPALFVGYGGAAGEEGEYTRALRSKAFGGHKQNWNGQAAYLKDVPAADQQYIEEADRDLIADLQEYAAEGGRLDLERLMTDLRTATLAGDESKVTQLSDMIRRVHNYDKAGKELTVARGRARAKATTEVLAISNQFRSKGMLGYSLFDSAEEARQAIDAFGFSDEQYPDQKRGPSTEAERLQFLQRAVGSDDGITKLTAHLFSGLQGGEDGVPVGIALDQLQLKGEQVLKMLQLEDRPEIRSKLETRLRELTGTDASAVIEAQGGAIGQLHSYNYAAVDRATRRASSHYSLLTPQERLRYREDYDREVFSVAATPDEMADTLQATINEFRGERPGFTQPSAYFFDSTRFKGDDKRLRFNQEAAAEMGEAASLYDLHDLFRKKDSLYADMQDEAGRISDQSYFMASEPEPGFGAPVYTPVKRYKPWAQGEAASYLRGENSYRKEYEGSTSAENIDQNVINQLDRLDFMRSRDISQLEGLTPQETQMLVGIQNHLRSMPFGAAMRAVRGDETTGMAPTGFAFADMGLTITSPETAADAAELREPEDLRSRVINIDTERAAIRRAQRQLGNLNPGTTSFFDLNPRDERVEGEMLTPLAIEAEQKELARVEDQLTAMQTAQESSMAQSIRPRVGKFLAGKDFSTPEDLAKLLTEGLPRITGEKRDLVALEESPVDPLLQDMANAETASEAIDLMIDVFAETTTVYAQRQAVSLSTMTKQEFREAVLREAKMDYNVIRVQLNTIARGIGLRAQSGDFNASKLPGLLQAKIDVEAFNALAKDAGNPNANAMLALHIWSAHQSVLDR